MFHMKLLVSPIFKWQSEPMSEQEAAIRIGEALGRLRRERGLSQAEAGARIGMTSQGWSLYEAGRRAGLFRPDMQVRLTKALDATPEDLMLLAEVAPSPASASIGEPAGVQSKGRAFERSLPASGTRKRLHLDTDDMMPWASLGTVIEYEAGRSPKAGRGVVVQFHDGRLRVALWQRADEQNLTLTNGCGDVMRLLWRDVASVSAVTARIEPD